MKQTTIISIANQKGGVGKTTTTVNLSASLTAFEQKVLLIDLDPQGNATTGSGIDKFAVDNGTCEVLLGEASIKEAIVYSESGKYDVLTANSELTVAEVGLLEFDDRVSRLKTALEPLHGVYDFVLIDCPPSLNLLTVNALVASDGVLVPLQCEFYALEGISALLDTVQQIADTVNEGLEIKAVLRTMYDARNSLSVQVSEQLLAHFGDAVYQTIIPRNVRLAEAPSHGVPITSYDPSSRGSYAYMDLAAEMLEKMEGSPW